VERVGDDGLHAPALVMRDNYLQGEALSVKQMVDTAVGSYGLDAGRVYVTGCRNAMRLSDVPGALAFKSLLKPGDGCW